ncbi:MAG: hypothetical protein WA057_00875 [Candidatus Magasanikiibacteriota bacterium]
MGNPTQEGINPSAREVEGAFFGTDSRGKKYQPLETDEEIFVRERAKKVSRLKELLRYWNNGIDDFDITTRPVIDDDVEKLVSGGYPMAVAETAECLRFLKHDCGMSENDVKNSLVGVTPINSNWFDRDLEKHILEVYREI